MTGRGKAIVILPCCPRSSGLTLVELLVAMLLGILLSGAAAAAFLGGKRQYLYDDQLARIQENGRFAQRLLSRELLMAGFRGGLPLRASVPAASVAADCSAGNWALDGTVPLMMVDDHDGADIPVAVDATEYTCIAGRYVPAGTDVLAIKRTFARASLLRGVPAATLGRGRVETWYLRTPEGAAPSWELLPPGDLHDPARHDPRNSYWEASARVFFIRSYAVQAGDGLPTLCVEELAGNAMTTRCLVEGVEDMQVELGVDTDGDGVANRYRSAPGPGDLASAVTARVYLLLRSPVPLPGHVDARDYLLGSKRVPARHDAYLRRVFSASARLRNLGAGI